LIRQTNPDPERDAEDR